MTSWKTKYLEMKFKYINAKYKLTGGADNGASSNGEYINHIPNMIINETRNGPYTNEINHIPNMTMNETRNGAYTNEINYIPNNNNNQQNLRIVKEDQL